MAIPSPSIKPLLPAGGSHTLVYEGPIGQSGSSQDLNIDLSDIPLYIRQDPKFQSFLLLIVKSLDENFTFMGPAILDAADFHDTVAEGENAYVTVQITSDDADRECMVIVDSRYSASR